jgi:glycosyltransferase involved in cell wall biosynthesis
MKVLLVANYEPDRQRSMARYAEMLHTELLKRGHTAEIIRPVPITTRFIKTGGGLFRWLGYIDKYLLFPPLLWLRARRADLIHVCDHSNSMYLRWAGKTPRLVTAHDALAIRSALGHFPQNPTGPAGVKLQAWILRSLRYADKVICVSQKTRSDFQILLPGGPALAVVPNPLSSGFHPATAKEVSAIRAACGLAEGDEYLLHVGKDNWYKNRPGVLRIMTELRKHSRFSKVKLIMAGAPLPAALKPLAQELQGVIESVDPGDDQLRALYTGALALLFPSIEEGFGWPILEAQVCGCLVITTARPPMSEVAGAGAILINPEDPRAAAHTIIARIADADAMRSDGLQNAQGYSLANAMDAYCRIYQEAVSKVSQA